MKTDAYTSVVFASGAVEFSHSEWKEVECVRRILGPLGPLRPDMEMCTITHVQIP